MTDERVHQVLTDSVNYEFNIGIDLIVLSILYGVVRYSLQCPGLEAFAHAHKRGHEFKSRLRDVLEKAGVLIDENGSFRDPENWKAIVTQRRGNVYSFNLDSLDVMIIHGLLRIKEMYPGDIQFEFPESYAIVLDRIRAWCALCFIEMGFTIDEIMYMETASSEGGNYGH